MSFKSGCTRVQPSITEAGESYISGTLARSPYLETPPDHSIIPEAFFSPFETWALEYKTPL